MRGYNEKIVFYYRSSSSVENQVMFISRVNATPSRQNFGIKVKEYSRIENPSSPVLKQGREILQTLAPDAKSTLTIYAVKGRDTLHGWIEPAADVKKQINKLANTSAGERNSLDKSEFNVSLKVLTDPEKRKEFEQKTLRGYEQWVGIHINSKKP